MPSRLWWLPWIAAVLGLAYLCTWGVRTVIADHYLNLVETNQSMPDGQAVPLLHAAIRYRPDRARGYRDLANRLLAADPSAAGLALHKAIERDPQDWRSWQMLAMAQLEQNQLPQATASLQKAARLDQGFASHFAAANLALILGHERLYWSEMKTALAMAPPQNLGEAVNSALRAAGTPPVEFLAHIPNMTHVQAAAVMALLSQHDLASAIEVYGRMHCSPRTQPQCADTAVAVAGDGLAWAWQNEFAGAKLLPRTMQIWNTAVRRNGLRQPRVVEGQVTNGEFRHAWASMGFTWRGGTQVPIAVVRGEDTGSFYVEIALTGNEPDDTLLMSQLVPVAPGRRYRLQFRARSAGEPGMQGLAVQISDRRNGELAESSPKLSSTWQSVQTTFQAPAVGHLVDLAVRYERPAGQPAWAGAVDVASFRLTKLPAASSNN